MKERLVQNFPMPSSGNWTWKLLVKFQTCTPISYKLKTHKIMTSQLEQNRIERKTSLVVDLYI